ncbi:MAG: transcription termination factor NusA [Patescibacteria group bacterium]|nr:transcription termination factor NusA [Patescibacteria group bacterium]
MSELTNAIKLVCEEKNLDYNTVVNTIELALAAAYRKDYGEKNQNIKVKFDPETATSQIFDIKTVVEDLPEQEEAEMLQRLYGPVDKNAKEEPVYVEPELDADGEEIRRFNPKTDIQLKEAKILKTGAQIGDEIITDLPIPESYGRMAAQTAKQVIIQKLREMERDMIFGEFKDKEGEVISGAVQRREGRLVFIDLGKAIGLLPPEEQIYSERYEVGDRYKIYVKEVREGHRGPEIILSRRSEEILKKVFYLEIPEVANGLVELKAVAREAGSRSKVAIWTDAENVDPVGSCVGQRGSRIQTIISELGGEKVDIIEYSENAEKFIANSLAPAKVVDIKLIEAEHKAVVKVDPDKLSLAIGKSGQNVRLAAHLTGWKIDIISDGDEVVASDSGEVMVAAEEENTEKDSIPEEVIDEDAAKKIEKKVVKKSSKVKKEI